MEFSEQPQPARFGWLTRFVIRLTGADEPTLAMCPERDLDNVKAIAFLMIAVWIYQSSLFAIIAHLVLAAGAIIRPELVAGALLIATIILLVDSYTIMRSSWHLHGISELKRGGIDISGGIGAQIKNWLFLAVRLALAVILAQLTAIFLSLLLFHNDVAAELDRTYQRQNAALFAEAAACVDAEIDVATTRVEATGNHITALQQEIEKRRGINVAETVDHSRLQAARARVAQLAQQKLIADQRLAAATEFASDELLGIKRAPGNTGKAGRGPARDAAEEKVRFAAKEQSDVAKELDAARAALDAAAADDAQAIAEGQRLAQQRLAQISADLGAAEQLLVK